MHHGPSPSHPYETAVDKASIDADFSYGQNRSDKRFESIIAKIHRAKTTPPSQENIHQYLPAHHLQGSTGGSPLAGEVAPPQFQLAAHDVCQPHE
jgi:hypothetical protein